MAHQLPRVADGIISTLSKFCTEQQQQFTNIQSHEEEVYPTAAAQCYHHQSQLLLHGSLITLATKLFNHCRFSESCFPIAFKFICRFISSTNQVYLSTSNVHTMLLTALLLAAKVQDDRYSSNASFAAAAAACCEEGVIITLHELNQLEVEMLFGLHFNTFMDDMEFWQIVIACEDLVQQQHNATTTGPLFEMLQGAHSAARYSAVCQPTAFSVYGLRDDDDSESIQTEARRSRRPHRPPPQLFPSDDDDDDDDDYDDDDDAPRRVPDTIEFHSLSTSSSDRLSSMIERCPLPSGAPVWEEEHNNLSL